MNGPTAANTFAKTVESLIEPLLQRTNNEAEIDRYLAGHKRSREALIAAGLLTGNRALLREAAERFPDDPHVQFLAVSNEFFPEKQREWVERFKASEPGNSLGAYFMAGEHFKAGETAAALEELYTGARLGNFQDYSNEGMLAMEAAALDLGGSLLEAKVGSTFCFDLELKSLPAENAEDGDGR